MGRRAGAVHGDGAGRRLRRLPHPAGVRADAVGSAAMAGLSELAARLRAELGAAQVITDRQELRTYECDGLAHYKVVPGLVVLPETTAEVAAVVTGLHAGRRAVRGPRLRHRPVRRGAAARRRRPDRHLADARDPRGRPGRPARRRRAGRDQPAGDPRRRARRLLLRARPVQPAGLLDRRQRRGELRRRALPEVRLHHQPRARRARSSAGRRGGRARRQGARPARLRPARRVRRLRGHARHRHRGDRAADPAAGVGADAAGRASTAPTRPARRSRRSSPPAWCRPRSR